MASDRQIDYKVVLADLEARRMELDAAIAAVKRILRYADVDQNQPSSKEAVDETQNENGTAPKELTDDTFFGLSIADATVKYLRMVKRKKSAKEISEALVKGGFITESKNFYGTVWATLDREASKEGSELRKVKKQWGLSEWYGSRKKSGDQSNEG